MKKHQGLVYIGKIITLEDIPNAHFIRSATVVCGAGGKWRGIVRKDQFTVGQLCNVFLPDSLVPPNESMQFLESSNWRVTMKKFRGVPSEVVIMPFPEAYHGDMKVGDDLTEWFGVTKYCKPIPVHLQGLAKGLFPSFIPKTDELNYQRHPELVEELHGKAYYVTEKADGSSTTAFHYKGEFGICSRNLELRRDENNGYWQVAKKYDVESNLPEGYALQWETCGPKIQGNPMGLTEIDAFAFSAYNIEERRYLDGEEFFIFCKTLGFPTVRWLDTGLSFDKEKVHTFGEGTYENGNQREGVVVRSQDNHFGQNPISFKVINLNYEK